jgi:hypothetical protein
MLERYLELARQLQEGLLVAAEYKRMEETSSVNGYLGAKY